MPTKQITINRFDGGISDDIREPNITKFAMSKFFDIFSNPHQLTPFRDTEADSTGQYKIGAFLYSSTNPTSGNAELLGLGAESGNNRPVIYYKGGSGLITDNWNKDGDRANWALGSGSVQYELFKEYRSYIYFWIGTDLIKAKLDYSGAMTTVSSGVTTTFRCQGIIHPATNKLYIPYSTSAGTYLGSVNNTTWNDGTSGGLTIAASLRITSACEYSNYLALAGYDVDGRNSKVLIYDVVNAPTQPTEIIDWGEGQIKVLNNLEGVLVGVSQSASDVFSLTSSKLSIKMWSGGKPRVIKELLIDSSSSIILSQNVNQVKDNKLYFSAKLSTTDFGLWSFGRKNINSNYALTLDRVGTNDYTDANNGIYAAIYLGDVCWTVHSAVGTVTRTNDQASYTATSIYESQKFREFPLAQLTEVLLDYVTLTSGATIHVKYKADNDSYWKRIFKKSYDADDPTDATVKHIATSIETQHDPTDNSVLDTVTMTSASPCVVTMSNHGLVPNQPFQFATTGALYTGITAGKTYYVLSTDRTENTFKFAASVGGTAINTSGSQSGTHTLIRDAELPEYREIQFRIESTGGAKITGLTFTYQSKAPQRG